MSSRSGQAWVDELLRQATGTRLTRNIIATVAQQDYFMKRARDNGGARSASRPEGYFILESDYRNLRELARALGTAVPEPGELVSVAVAPTSVGVEIGDELWRLREPGRQQPSLLPSSVAAAETDAARR